jgi:hypothetical protein
MTITDPTDLPEPLPELPLQTSNRQVMHFLDNWRDDEFFDLDAPYQRGSVWDDDRRRALIRSVLLRLPFGAITTARMPYKPGSSFSERVVDGKQRILALRAFSNDDLAVPGHWFSADQLGDPAMRAGDVRYSDLSDPGRRGFESAPVANTEFDPAKIAYLDDDGVWQHRKAGDDEILRREAELFGLINGGGVDQDAETMARARAIAEG